MSRKRFDGSLGFIWEQIMLLRVGGLWFGGQKAGEEAPASLQRVEGQMCNIWGQEPGWKSQTRPHGSRLG